MKKIILLLGIILSLSLNAQPEMKGLILDNKYDGDQFRETTLGGLKGQLVGRTLNDGTLYSISFICSNDGINVTRIYVFEVNILVTGMETKYNIKFEKRRVKADTDFWVYRASRNGYTYFIYTKYNEFIIPSTECSIYIQNDYLFKVNNQEQQAKVNKDF